MKFQGTVITIWSSKGGVGKTTILASVLRKFKSSPRKVAFITDSAYTHAIMERTGVKSDKFEPGDIGEFNNLLDDLTNESKKFRRYDYIFIDCGFSTCDDITPIDDLKNNSLLNKVIEKSHIIIGVFVPDSNHRETQHRFETCILKNNTEQKKVILLLNRTKPNYGTNTEENTIKYLDQMCEKYNLFKLNETMGYSKFIELENRSLDTKACKGALFALIDYIKDNANE